MAPSTHTLLNREPSGLDQGSSVLTDHSHTPTTQAHAPRPSAHDRPAADHPRDPGGWLPRSLRRRRGGFALRWRGLRIGGSAAKRVAHSDPFAGSNTGFRRSDLHLGEVQVHDDGLARKEFEEQDLDCRQ